MTKDIILNRVLTVNARTLHAALKEAKRVIPSRAHAPILYHALIRGATLTVTDLDNILTLDLPGAITSPDHAFTVPVDLLLKAMAGMDCTQIHAEELTVPNPAAKDVSGTMRWTIGDMQIDLTCLPPADFPALRDLADGWEIQMQARTMRDMLKVAEHSVSTEETRYYLRGVNFCGEYAGPDAIPTFAAVSTDGHRLTHVSMPDLKWAGDPILVPHDTINLVISLTAQDGAVNVLTNNRTLVQFTGPNWRLVAKVIDGKFPDYTLVMPKAADTKGASIVDCDDIKAKAKRIVALSDSRACATEVDAAAGTLTHKGDAIKTITIKSDFTSVHERGHCPAYGVSARYLAEAMEALRIFGPKAIIAAENGSNPHTIQPMTQPAGMHITAVCMPVRV